MRRLALAPLHRDEANAFVTKWHRHHGPLRGSKFCLGAAMRHAGKKTRNRLFPVWRKARRLSPASTERLTHVLTDEAGTPMPRPERRAFADDVAFMAAHHGWRDQIADTANRALDEAFRKAWQPAKARRR